MGTLASLLEADGFDTFLPQRDGIEAYVMRHVNGPLAGAPGLGAVGSLVGRATFALDVYQVLERCDALVVNLNGRVPDEGAVAETALAWASGRPVVLYKQDDRTIFSGEDNAMVTGLGGFETVNRMQDVPGALHRRLADAPPTPEPATRPPDVQETLRLGRRVWTFVRSLPRARGTHHDVPALLRELERVVRSDDPADPIE